MPAYIYAHVQIMHVTASAHSNRSTNTPLYLACRSASCGAAATALLLITAGADVNSKNFGHGTDISHCETPLHAAAEVLAPRRDQAAAATSVNATECGTDLWHNEVTVSSISCLWACSCGCRLSMLCWLQAPSSMPETSTLRFIILFCCPLLPSH